MNKKGFTLVELLVVVIILSLLIAFVLPQITNSVKNYQSKVDKLTTKLVIDAAKLYVGDNSNKYPKESASSYCIPLKELIENDYLKNKIKLNDIDVTNSKSVMVTYDGTFNYELVDSSKCESYNPICEAVTEDTVTVGNIPNGNFESGDEYICEVKPGTKYNFFVLSQESDGTTNLIMERNICEDGTVATESTPCLVAWYAPNLNNSYGPVTAMNYLHNATDDWTNIPNIKMNYEDENIHSDTGEKGTIGYGAIKTTDNITKITKKDGTVVTVLENQEGYTNVKARLPRYNEVHGEGKCLTYKENGNRYGSCPLYLINYLSSISYVTGAGLQNISGIYGYWTLSSGAVSSGHAWYVYFYGEVWNTSVYVGYHGVRPVINLKL